MPLPSNFNRWSHLRSVLLNSHNKLVREEFADVGGDNWSPEITTSRGSLRVACTVQATDSVNIAMTKMQLFYDTLGYGKSSDVIYGLPAGLYQEMVRYYPQVFLYFKEDKASAMSHPTTPRGEGKLSVRLLGVTTEEITQATVNLVASRVRAQFSGGSGFVWQKGRRNFVYYDKDKGLQFKILNRVTTHGQEVAQSLLAVIGESYNNKWATPAIPQNQTARYPKNPGSFSAFGKIYRKIQHRPEVDVRFQYAVLHLHGIPRPIALVDRVGKLKNPIHRD